MGGWNVNIIIEITLVLIKGIQSGYALWDTPMFFLLRHRSIFRGLIHWLLFKNYFLNVSFKLADCGSWVSKIVFLVPHSTLLGLCFLAVTQRLSKGSGLSWDGGQQTQVQPEPES